MGGRSHGQCPDPYLVPAAPKKTDAENDGGKSDSVKDGATPHKARRRLRFRASPPFYLRNCMIGAAFNSGGWTELIQTGPNTGGAVRCSADLISSGLLAPLRCCRLSPVSKWKLLPQTARVDPCNERRVSLSNSESHRASSARRGAEIAARMSCHVRRSRYIRDRGRRTLRQLIY